MILIQFINSNPDWETKLKEKKIRIKHKGLRTMFNYGIGADFSDPLVRECRGVILDEKLNVVCRGFDKFGNYSESYAAEIDWDSAKVQQKLDGSLMKLYFYGGKWRWATNGMIDAFDAEAQGGRFRNFGDMVLEAENYPQIEWDSLSPNKTYIFEIVSPYNQHVVKYTRTELYHIGTRDNSTGEESIEDIGIQHPKEYSYHNIDECIDAVNHMNSSEECEYEGFVVCDKHFNRVKIKTPEYFKLHRVKTGSLDMKSAVELLLGGSYDEAVKAFPEHGVELAWYEYQIQLFLREKKRMETYAVNLFQEYEGDRKLVAKEIAQHPYAYFGFAMINGKRSEIDYGMIKKFIAPPK